MNKYKSNKKPKWNKLLFLLAIKNPTTEKGYLMWNLVAHGMP
jgi:hypothetical protein